jgi:hypothetical protein
MPSGRVEAVSRAGFAASPEASGGALDAGRGGLLAGRGGLEDG